MWLLTCTKTGRSWSAGLRTEAMAMRAARTLGLKDYSIMEITQ